MEWQHVYPLNDKKSHNTESHPFSVVGTSPVEGTVYCQWADGCECKPLVDFDNCIVVHNAFDCREVIEQAESLLKKKVYLRKLPGWTFLCHKGTVTPIDFNSQEEAQQYLDNNCDPEDNFEIHILEENP